ncbi:MAG: TonB-dependent receptor [Acidobacteriota bacterium]|nr:TonB-dependent receptor [Acidobacteriota bacterium]
MKTNRTIFLSGAASIFLMGSPAYSQVAPPSASEGTPPPTAARGDNGIADIIVTAQRRNENLQRAAVAITAINGDDVARSWIVRAEDLTASVPALSITSGGTTFSQVYLRGVGNAGQNTFAENAVAFNFDGVYISSPTGVNGLFYDLARVEVLKGPQGTLYGRNATGGAINVIPNKPSYKRELELAIDVGNYDLIRTTGSVNIPLVEGKAALRASFQVNSRGAYYNDGTGDDRSQAARLQLRLDPTPTLNIVLSADYFHRGGTGPGAHIVSPAQNGSEWDGLHSPNAIATYAAFGLPEVGISPLTNERFSDFENNYYYGVHATLEWKTGIGNLTIIPAYRRNKQNFSETFSSFLQHVEGDSNQKSLEVRLGSDSVSRLSYVVGGYLFREKIFGDQYYNQVINALRTIQTLHNSSAAAFGQLTFSVTNHLRLTGGLRFTHEQKSQDTLLYTRVTPPFVIPGNPPIFVPAQAFPFQGPGSIPPTAIKGDTSFNNTSWKAGAEWDVGSRSLLYANASTAFKAGGFYGAVAPNTYRPEFLTAYTIGLKNRFFDNRLQLNIEAFYWKYRDQQVSFLAVRPDNSVIFPTVNVGQSTIKGIEVEALLRPVKNTLISAQVQYNDARYNKFTYVLANFSGPSDVANRTSCPFTQTGPVTYSLDCSGLRLPQAPKWRINLGLTQTIPLSSGGSIIANVRTAFESKRYLTFDFTQLLSEGNTTRTSASLTYETPGERMSAGLFIDNIENNAVKQTGYYNPLLPITVALYAPPRVFGLRLTAKIGQ